MRLIVRSRPDGGQSPLCDVPARGAVSPILRPSARNCKTKPPGPPENQPEQARRMIPGEHLKRARRAQVAIKKSRAGKLSLAPFSPNKRRGRGRFLPSIRDFTPAERAAGGDSPVLGGCVFCSPNEGRKSGLKANRLLRPTGTYTATDANRPGRHDLSTPVERNVEIRNGASEPGGQSGGTNTDHYRQQTTRRDAPVSHTDHEVEHMVLFGKFRNR